MVKVNTVFGSQKLDFNIIWWQVWQKMPLNCLWFIIATKFYKSNFEFWTTIWDAQRSVRKILF